MILPTMTYDEIINEVKDDLSFVLDVSDRKDAKVRRLIQKATQFPCRLHSFITSKRKNKWLIMWEAKNKKGIGDDSLFTFACILDTLKGKFVIMPSFVHGEFTPIIFLPHFFQRFAQRMNLSLTGDDLIRRYLQFNAHFSIETKEQRINEQTIEIIATGTTEEGVGLGYKIGRENGFLFKTFITYDMARGSQIESFRASEARRIKFYEAFFKQIENE